jgi:CRP-like cAMP-binding protein
MPRPLKIHAESHAKAYESACIRIVGKDYDIAVSAGMPADNTIFRAGDPGDCMFVVAEGAVEIDLAGTVVERGSSRLDSSIRINRGNCLRLE